MEYETPPVIEPADRAPNEQLALAAKSGDTAALEQLWRQTVRLVFKLMGRYYPLCPRFGVAPEDLMQESYAVVLAATKACDSAKPHKFTSYLGYQVQLAVRRVFGWRREERPTSLNVPTGEEGGELADLLPDPDGEAHKHALEESDLAAIVREELDGLPEQERRVVICRFYGGLSMPQIAKQLGTTTSAATNAQTRAFTKLRQSPVLWALWREHYAHSNVSRVRWMDGDPRLYDVRHRLEAVEEEAGRRVRQLVESGAYLSYGHRRHLLDYPALRLLDALQKSFDQ